MFQVLFGGSRFVVWTLGPALILFAVCVPAFSDAMPGRSAGGIVLLEAIVLTTALAVMWPRRFGWAGRVIAAAAAAGWAALAVDVLRRGVELGDLAGLAFSFLVFGLPGAQYAIQGGRRPQPGSRPAEAATSDTPGGAVEPGAIVGEAAALAAGVREASATGSTGEVFASKLEWLLATHPHLRADVQLEGGRGTVTFQREGETGFYVGVLVTPEEIVVHAGLAHVHFGGGDPAQIATGAIACVTDLLGPDYRLRERLAGGRPYLARIEVRTPDGWRVVTTTGLLVWNYLGRREERILQNRLLPGRVRPG